MHTPNAPQVYPYCFQANLISSGTVKPTETVKFPDAYQMNTDYLSHSIYGGDDAAFVAPGPPVYNAGGAPAPAPVPTTTAESEVPATTTADVPTTSTDEYPATSDVAVPTESSDVAVPTSDVATPTETSDVAAPTSDASVPAGTPTASKPGYPAPEETSSVAEPEYPAPSVSVPAESRYVQQRCSYLVKKRSTT